MRILSRVVRTGKSAARKIQGAHALLEMDRNEEGNGWDDERISEVFGMTVRSLKSWHKKTVAEGPEAPAAPSTADNS